MDGVSKLGSYINKLMTTVLDKDRDEFVTNLALDELKRLNVDINEFIMKSVSSEEMPKVNKSEKQLLQEDK
jgi:hypothetical protein